jgi:hypothetical protein
MANPKTSTLIDFFLPDGYGAFGYGSGSYGGGTELLNPQWNTTSGNFGIDVLTNLPYIEATSTPSYLGAALYDITNDSFFAKIVPAPSGNGGTQTALIVKDNNNNYVTMSVGPQGNFSAYGVNDSSVVNISSNMPAYNPTAHAYWRIRNDSVLFHFDVSPDGSTWTELGSVSYLWDTSSVVVSIFAGFTGIESPGNLALVSHINLPGTTLALSATTGASAAAHGLAVLSSPNALKASVNGISGLHASFKVSLGLPEGGVTDFAFSQGSTTGAGNLDSARFNGYFAPIFNSATSSNGATFTQNKWVRSLATLSAPTQYRDGSYWQPAEYASIDANSHAIPQTGTNFLSSVQLSPNSLVGISNRLSLDASLYITQCCYGAGPGVLTAFRSSDVTLTGAYSGKVISTSSPTTIGTGQLAYYPLPQKAGMTPVLLENATYESLYASVSLYVLRANTNWFATILYYDANFNILTTGASNTIASATISNMNVHPGGGTWQTGIINTAGVPAPTNSVWMSVVPVVINSGSLIETVHMDNHYIVGTNTFIAGQVTPNYASPRNADIVVKADRVNYVANAGFNTNTTGWFQTNVNTSGTPNPVTMSWDGTTGFNSLGSMKVNFVAPSGSFSGNTTTGQLGTSTPGSFTGGASVPVVQGLKIGHTYTISAYVKQSLGCPDVMMNFYDSNFTGVNALSTNAVKATNTVNGWTRISTTYTVPPGGVQDYSFYFYVMYRNYVLQPVFTFWVDSLLVEESQNVNSFFDGGFSTSDYQWESGGVVNNSRSYYYSNYTNKLNRLNVALPSVLPVGETYTLKFAQPVS